MSPSSFEEAKRKVTERLMPLDFVSGVGGSDKLSIMLDRPISDAEHQHIQKVMQEDARGYDYDLVHTGKFRKV
jgi:hypothetical protein